MAKVWLITGSSRDLARTLAEAVLAAGDQIVATARRPAQLSDMMDRHGGQVRAAPRRDRRTRSRQCHPERGRCLWQAHARQ